MNYNFDKIENRKGTFSTQWDYIADRFGNDDVLPFSISDMDIKLPQQLIQYLQKQLETGIYGYTRWKNEYLLEAIKGWYKNRYNVSIEFENITYSPTVIFSISLLLNILSKQGDKVLTFIPAYDAFFNIIEKNNRKLICCNVENKDEKYIIKKEDFENKIKQCKILLLCSPYNPIGKVWDEQELMYIVNICRKYNVKIISDEIHMDITFTKKHIPIIKIARELDYSQNVVIATSATKSFNFPGLLFSYVISDNLEVLNNFTNDLKYKNGLSSCTILGMHATAYAYNHLEKWLDQLIQYINENYIYIKKRLQKYKIKINEFDGTYLLWLDVSEYNLQKLLNIMYNKTKVGFMSGEVYGFDNHLRINIGCSKEKIKEGLDRFEQSLKMLDKL